MRRRTPTGTPAAATSPISARAASTASTRPYFDGIVPRGQHYPPRPDSRGHPRHRLYPPRRDVAVHERRRSGATATIVGRRTNRNCVCMMVRDRKSVV